MRKDVRLTLYVEEQYMVKEHSSIRMLSYETLLCSFVTHCQTLKKLYAKS